MAKLLYLAALCLLAIVQAKPKTRVVGGDNAPDGKYPYQAYLKVGKSYLCGASILNEHYILTAAHCVSGKQSSDLTVILGTNSRLTDDADVYQVATYEPHEEYSYPSIVAPINDIALVRLTKKIVFNDKVQPVKLPAQDTDSVPESVILTGWGNLKFLGSSPVTLQEIKLKVLDQTTCGKRWMDYKKVTIVDTQICTLTKSGEGACNGDSGGPLVADGVQIGIVSFGGMPCGKGVPDVFTRVSSYVDWINRHTY